MAGKAPKTRQKLSPEARAEQGRQRICVECDETKEVNHKNYAPSKRPDRSFRGWSTVCRACQGVQRAERRETIQEYQRTITDDTDLVNRMYLCHPLNDSEELDEIIARLGQRIRDLPRKQSLELFIEVLAPLIADWKTPGAIHDDIKDGLLSDNNRVLVIATRYSAKSTLTAIYATWEIFLNPLVKIMVISRGEKLAKRMLRTVRHVFIQNCPLLSHLVPTDDCLDSAEQFQTPQTLKMSTGGVTLMSLGVTSNLPGYRSDITIGDDVEGPQEDTPEKVVALEETLNELHMINPKGRKIMLGTYQTEFSVYARLADKEDRDGNSVWELHRACMFAEGTDDKGRPAYQSRWPAMFTDDDAMDWRRSVTERAWRLHAMLIADPAILNERPLKIGDFVLVDWPSQSADFPLLVEPGGPPRDDLTTWAAPKGDKWISARRTSEDRAPYVMTIAAIDPASGLAGRDAIGVAVLGITATGFGVVRHLEGVRAAKKEDSRRRVASIVRDFRATVLVVEEMEDGLFGETLEGELVLLGYPMSVEKVTTGQMKKGQRIIESLAPPMGAGRLVMLEGVARSDHGGEFVNQMVRVSYDGRTGKAKDHDDIVDALSHAVARAKTSLISDLAENMAEHNIGRVENIRYLPVAKGGLGGDAGFTPGAMRRLSMVDGRAGLDTGLSLAERLVEEDETLTKMIARRDRLQDAINQDLHQGRQADAAMVRRVQSLTHQIADLKALQVL